VSHSQQEAAPALAHPARFFAEAASDLKRARPAAWRLFRANVRARYRRAWLGYLWLLLPAAATAALCAFIRARGIVSAGPTALPYPLFVLSGVMLWQAFSEALQAPLQQLGAARRTITRMPVPHEAVIGAGLLEVLLAAGVRLAVLGIAIAILAPGVSPSVLLLPLGFLALALLGLALGLLAAPFGLLWDDVGRGMFLFTAFLFFVTPVVYPLPRRGLLLFNPVTPLLDTSRAWISGPAAPWAFLAAVAVSLLLLAGAWLFYRLARPHVVARLG
jgi:lipopolysaccharide transport system permease protein